LPEVSVTIDPEHVRRTIGHAVSNEDLTRILTDLAFRVDHENGQLKVSVPSFRATKDISIEADVIEEIARCVGYDNIEPVLPDVTVRHYPPNPQHRLERDTLRNFTLHQGYHEIHLYCWFDDSWMRQIGVAPGPALELRNPASAGQASMRQALMPGLLAATDRNRLHADAFRLCEIGTVWPADPKATTQSRRIGLVHARRGKKAEDALFAALKGDLEAWGLQVLGHPPTYGRPDDAALPAWAHPGKSASVHIAGIPVGWVSVVPLDLRRRVDEHLAAWGIAWAEIDLDPLQDLTEPDCHLQPVPPFPEVELDFSLLVPATAAYGAVNQALAAFDDERLRRINFVTAFEGKAIPEGKRSLTYRLRLGAADRTLVDADLAGVRSAFEAHIKSCGFELRS
jgi:phenylalanyl-tRNA synthetase beta chain